jgi:hypothetical protein
MLKIGYQGICPTFGDGIMTTMLGKRASSYFMFMYILKLSLILINQENREKMKIDLCQDDAYYLSEIVEQIQILCNNNILLLTTLTRVGKERLIGKIILQRQLLVRQWW